MRTVRHAMAIVSIALIGACAHKTSPSTSVPAQLPDGAGPQAAARLGLSDLDTRMKTIGTTLGSLRTKLMSNALTDAGKDAQTLATAFGEVERFFQQRNKPDAVTWAQQARTSAQDAAGAASAGDSTKASMAVTTLQTHCSRCHAAYREGDAQSGFRIKAGTLAP